MARRAPASGSGGGTVVARGCVVGGCGGKRGGSDLSTFGLCTGETTRTGRRAIPSSMVPRVLGSAFRYGYRSSRRLTTLAVSWSVIASPESCIGAAKLGQPGLYSRRSEKARSCATFRSFSWATESFCGRAPGFHCRGKPARRNLGFEFAPGSRSSVLDPSPSEISTEMHEPNFELEESAARSTVVSNLEMVKLTAECRLSLGYDRGPRPARLMGGARNRRSGAAAALYLSRPAAGGSF